MLKGEPAPYAGHLITKQLSDELMDDSCHEKRRSDQKAAAKELKNRVGEQKDLRKSDAETAAAREKLLQDELDRETAFYRDPAFVIPVTVVLTIGLVVATGFALGQVSNANSVIGIATTQPTAVAALRSVGNFARPRYGLAVTGGF